MDRRMFLGTATAGVLPAIKERGTGQLRGVAVLYYPPDLICMGDGTTKSAQDLAKELASELSNGCVLLLPSSRDHLGNLLWDFRIEGGPIEQVKVERIKS